MRSAPIFKNPVITGTVILTCAGCISRIIGFFYRIFLTHTIGADGIGIYQLCTPVITLSFAITCAGLQTAISRYTARCMAKKEQHTARLYLTAGMLLSLALSALCMWLLLSYPQEIAHHFLKEDACAPLVRALAFSIPCASIHSCVNGYYYGQKKSLFPSVTQLMEQIGRVGFVYLMFYIQRSKNMTLTPVYAAYGIVAGELVSMLLSLTAVGFSRVSLRCFSYGKKLLEMAVPLSANRILLTLFQSAETILIPRMLISYGYKRQEALSVFGILTGMAIPVILFPAVLTNSFSTLLLPVVSEAQAEVRADSIRRALLQSILGCLTLGLGCTLFFLLFGRWLGNFLFHSVLAGSFLISLSWLCPFLYLTTTLTGILHGLGKTTFSLMLNVGGCLIRIFFIFVLIPFLGLRAYFWGLLLSHLLFALFATFPILIGSQKNTAD